MLKSRFPWERAVIEGIGITPKLARDLEAQFTEITWKPMILYENNVERIRERIETRGLWGPKGTYPADLIEKEIEWVILYNEFFKAESQKHGFDITLVDDLLTT